jgi:ABC-type branched-subunit amino acid transport system ATPase component/ABC-type branched-subunit amino acid transport system permease subunit
VGRRPPRWISGIVTAACVALALLAPTLFEGQFFLFYLVDVLLFGLAALGLQHIVGDAGVLSLGHAAFFGLGAYGGAYATQEWEWTTLPAVGFGVALALVGALLMLPLLRLRGVYFAMATFALGFVLFEAFRLADTVSGGDSGRFAIPAPEIAGKTFLSTEDFYYVALAAVLLAYASLSLLARSGYGLTLDALRQSELAARASGINVPRVQTIALAIGVSLAAVSGTLYAQFHGAITPPLFSPEQSVTFLAMVILGGMRARWGAFVGAAFALYLSTYLRFLVEYQVLAYGAIIAVFMVVLPGGVASIPTAGSELVEGVRRWRLRRVAYERRPRPAHAPALDALLQVEGLVTGYARAEAVHGVSFEVHEGEVLAILGANGAGKTSTMRAVSGLLPVWAGSITLAGHDITRTSAHAIARRGLALVPEGRHIFPQLSVEDNLRVGARGSSADLVTESRRALSLFPPLEPLLHRPGSTLSGGEQQMLAIARALMSSPRVLLLDEPSLGLAPLVVERVFDTIDEIRDLGVAIVLVEQNARLALRASDRAIVLRQGSIAVEGSSDRLTTDPLVRRAYLGA